MKKIKELFIKYKEQILYLFFGGITFLVSSVIIFVLDRNGIIGIKARIISDVVAIIVAYITNKIWVFESKCNSLKELLKEMLSFFSARAFTTVLSLLSSYVFVDKLHYNNLIVQYSTTVIVIILNYVFSKLFIFKKK